MSESSLPFLKVSNLCYSYNNEDLILNNINFTLNKGESLGVLGPNGGGKSTLMKIIAGLIKPQSGSICFKGIEATTLSQYPYHFLSYVPQNQELNTILPVSVSEFLGFSFSHFNIKNPQKLESELLELVGMTHKKNSLLSQLSGGEKQRVLIARSMINRPELLLLDEPTKGLDSNGQDALLSIIEDIKLNHRTAVIIVDHNINQIIKSCQNILCLNRQHHWHDHKDFLTKNILEDIYHCEFEHLLIHEKDLNTNETQKHNHQFCQHDHSVSEKLKAHPFLRNKS